ncbi:MAG: esterase family protein [Bacteroidales bacterium]|nr:esterase family protein [Bacteroidales bacterium]
MKKMYLMYFLVAGLLFQGHSGYAQSADRGKVMEGLVFHSSLMGDVRYTIYLPPGYETDARKYPVVYLLHGYTDDDTGWLQFGEADRIAGDAIIKGEIPPMILVMPDGGVTWYVNDYKGKKPWADMFIKEFIPYVDKTYRTRPEKQFRGIAGLSMGGYGALHTAMRNPDMFAASVAFSSGTYTDEQLIKMDSKSYKHVFGFLFGEGLEGKDRITDAWKSFSPLHLLETQPFDKLKTVRWYLDIGDDDFLYKGNSALHVKMRDMGLTHEYRVRDGKHAWVYWRTGLKNGLQFIGKSFHR